MIEQSAASFDPERTVPDPVGRLLKISEVMNEVGLSRAQIYRLMRDRKNPFPAPIKIGSASRWSTSEIIGWKQKALDNRDVRPASSDVHPEGRGGG